MGAVATTSAGFIRGVGTVNVGRTPVCGTTNFGAGAAGGGTGSGTPWYERLALRERLVSLPLAVRRLRDVREAAEQQPAVACVIMAFKTSPGLRNLHERSILVLIPSASGRLGRDDLVEIWASLAPRIWARTFAASCSSTELGMGLLLGDANRRQSIENDLTFNFQLSGQIVDSNLTHPALSFLRLSR